ncbi:MAG: hypothetical protein AB3N64_07200 [Puniceicoccaceae bacterium]
MTTCDPKYRNKLLLWAVVYCSTVAGSIYVLKTSGIENFALQTVIALVPMLPIIWLMQIIMSCMHNLDELQRKIQLDAVVFAAVLTALLTVAYGFLEKIGYPKLDTIWIFPMLMVLWTIGQAIARRRYE